MHRGRAPLGLTCPACGSGLIGGDEDEADGSVRRLRCPGCGGRFRATPKPDTAGPKVGAIKRPPAVGGASLAIRAGILRGLPGTYRIGLAAGTTAMLALGGFIPVLRRWLNDEVAGFDDAARLMGGVAVASPSRDPDADFGPKLRRTDAPGLFDEVAEVARRLGARPPEEIRLAFLPCCGVVAWRRGRALLLGLPLLDVLTRAELRAILAHELAHLARGDATWSASSLRFVEGLGLALDDPSGRAWGPLKLWARGVRGLAARLVGPIATGQEARADRAAASIAGGRAAASALVKVALVQPLFRELLVRHDHDRAGSDNLYATFRRFWDRLPARLLEEMRLGLLAVEESGPSSSPHPPLPDRVGRAPGLRRRHRPRARSGPGCGPLRRPRLAGADASRQALRQLRRRAERLPQSGDLTAVEGRYDILSNLLPGELSRQSQRIEAIPTRRLGGTVPIGGVDPECCA